MGKKIRAAIFIILIANFFLIGIAAFFIFASNTKNSEVIQVVIPRHATCLQVLDTLMSHQILQHEVTFKTVAKAMRFKTMRTGKYNLRPHMSNYQLIKLLRQGQHYPVTLTFNNVRTLDDFVDRVGHRFFFAPEELRSLLHDDDFLKKYGLTVASCPAIFIPDSYQIYYDVSAEEFFDKMYENYRQFWTGRREQTAETIGLSPMETAILASIVMEENHRPKEWAIIAGLYINRLHTGMPLQSDPTIKFALGDFGRQRILHVDLCVDSPYNTYLHAGLPPGPICLPDGAAIDSVLHYRHHNYLYMCAKEDLSGYHNFTASPAAHARNAQRYRAALQARHIRH